MFKTGVSGNGGSPRPWLSILKWSSLDDSRVPPFQETCKYFKFYLVHFHMLHETICIFSPIPRQTQYHIKLVIYCISTYVYIYIYINIYIYYYIYIYILIYTYIYTCKHPSTTLIPQFQVHTYAEDENLHLQLLRPKETTPEHLERMNVEPMGVKQT